LILFGAGAGLGQQKTAPNEAAPSNTASYTIDDLGPFVVIADDVVPSLNRDGTVAYWTKVNGAVRATVWRGGKTTTIEDVAGYPNTIAHAINSRGEIAGWMNTSRNLVDSTSTTHGFIQHGGEIQNIPGLGGRDNRVLGLNDKGAAVGTASLAGGGRHAFLLTGTEAADLGTLPTGKSSAAYAINNKGVIVGEADKDSKANHAVSWVKGKIKDIGTLPGGHGSSARAINDRGQIVGFSDTDDGVRAFLYANGAMQDLGTLGSDPSEASGINNNGDVVGASNVTAHKRHAFLWRDGRMVDLNDLLPKGSPWIILNAFSINDRGQIVCTARSKTEPLHLLLLTPQQLTPQPGYAK